MVQFFKKTSACLTLGLFGVGLTQLCSANAQDPWRNIKQ